jgi:O-antigen/teichoic acid export membrane protein
MLKIMTTLGVLQVVASLIYLIRSKMLALLLGPQGVGVISVVDQATQFIGYVSAISLPYAGVKFLSRAHSKGFEEFRESYAALLKLLSMVTLIGVAVSLVVVFGFPRAIGTQLSGYRVFLLPALITVPAMSMHGLFVNVLGSAQRPLSSMWLLVIIALVVTIAAAAGVAVDGISGYYWANLLAMAILTAGAAVYLKRGLGLPILDRAASVKKQLRQNPDIVTFSLILFGASFTFPFSYFVARYMVLKGFGEAEAGMLQAAIALAAALSTVLSPINNLYLSPILNRSIPVQEKMVVATEMQGRLTVIICALAIPMALFPQWLLTILYSPAFVGVSRSVFLFVVAQCALQLGWVYQSLLIGLDDLKVYGAITSAGYLLIALFSWPLARRYGALGVAVSCLISSGSIFLMLYARLSLKHGLKLPFKLRVLMGYGLLVLLLAGAFFNRFDAMDFGVALTKLIVGGLFVASLTLFLDREEIKQLIDPISQAVLRTRKTS